MNKILSIFAITLALFCLGGCVHYGQFRDDARKDHTIPSVLPPVCQDDPAADPARKSIWCPAGDRKYYLAFIEVDEFGEMFDRRQLNRVMTLIQTVKRESNTVDEHGLPSHNAAVVTFIHGWKNNASDNSGNVWGFRDELRDIAAALESQFMQRKPVDGEGPEPVIGIYIGWRGSVTNLGVVKELTFFDRRNAAAQIPGAHLTEMLSAIMHQTKACIEECPPNSIEGPGTGSLSVVVGHSFGGLLLERTLTQAVASDLLNQEAANKDKQRRHELKADGNFIKPPADLIVMLNEAAPATESKQLIDLLKEHRMKLLVDNKDHPLFLSITSTGDWATGLMLPIGQGASSLFRKNFRKYANPKPKQIPDQKAFFLHTTAHLPPMFSHILGPESDTGVQQATISASDTERTEVDCFFIDFPHGSRESTRKRYCIAPVPGRYNDTPYWVMQMGMEFVPDHSQIFRPVFRKLLQQLIGERIDFTKPGAPLKPAVMKSE